LGNGNGATIFRLREGIERFMITDINNPAVNAEQSTLWIMLNQFGAQSGVHFSTMSPAGQMCFTWTGMLHLCLM